eukprot:m.320066 g.320066  ORF g.320066 m.320066 type:complete len:111 (-) comp20315_c0_seq2:662-994(-)
MTMCDATWLHPKHGRWKIESRMAHQYRVHHPRTLSQIGRQLHQGLLRKRRADLKVTRKHAVRGSAAQQKVSHFGQIAVGALSGLCAKTCVTKQDTTGSASGRTIFIIESM